MRESSNGIKLADELAVPMVYDPPTNKATVMKQEDFW